MQYLQTYYCISILTFLVILFALQHVLRDFLPLYRIGKVWQFIYIKFFFFLLPSSFFIPRLTSFVFLFKDKSAVTSNQEDDKWRLQKKKVQTILVMKQNERKKSSVTAFIRDLRFRNLQQLENYCTINNQLQLLHYNQQ